VTLRLTPPYRVRHLLTLLRPSTVLRIIYYLIAPPSPQGSIYTYSKQNRLNKKMTVQEQLSY